MGAIVVEVSPEIEHFVFDIHRGPEQYGIQILPSKGTDQPFRRTDGTGERSLPGATEKVDYRIT